MPYGNRKSGGKGYQASKGKGKKGPKGQTSGKAGQKKTYRMTGKAPGNKGAARKI